MYLLQLILSPLSIPYWIITYIRNVCYDKGIFKQTSFATPIISVGNITVGGTGKTPHVRSLISALEQSYTLGVVSRGYKRKTTGFVLAHKQSTLDDIGDEPYLIKQAHPNIYVAVDEQRVRGIETLLSKAPSIQTILLDDAFQHRALKPGLQIVLVDYNRPLWRDFVYPAGFLREGSYALRRADIVIVSKCPASISAKEQEIWKMKLKITHQKLFFTSIQYHSIYEFTTQKTIPLTDELFKRHILLITGIAQPMPLLTYVKSICNNVTHLKFADHYNYTTKDYDTILTNYRTYQTSILTTEKDAQKIYEITKGQIPIYIVPIEPKFINNDFTAFVQQVHTYIQKALV